jgi:flavin reductase (DIM6/NTAB) family NADH-FMN oxidoreductase RutF
MTTGVAVGALAELPVRPPAGLPMEATVGAPAGLPMGATVGAPAGLAMETTVAASAGELGAGVTGADFRRFMRGWPGGVAIVTATGPDGPAGCTITAFMSVSLEPPLALVSLSQRSHTLAAITGQGAFGVSLLPWRERGLATRFALRPSDRFAGVAYRLQHGIPVLNAAMAATVCELDQVIPVADHVLLLGRPHWCQRDETGEPAIFCGGSYCRPANPAA